MMWETHADQALRLASHGLWGPATSRLETLKHDCGAEAIAPAMMRWVTTASRGIDTSDTAWLRDSLPELDGTPEAIQWAGRLFTAQLTRDTTTHLQMVTDTSDPEVYAERIFALLYLCANVLCMEHALTARWN